MVRGEHVAFRLNGKNQDYPPDDFVKKTWRRRLFGCVPRSRWMPIHFGMND